MTMVLKPGSTITVVFQTNPYTETTDLRASIVYAIFEKKIVIAQTDPLIPKHLRKKTVTLSSLTRERSGMVRQGFSAKILDFIDDYRLASSQKVPALVVTPKSQSQLFNLRAGYRISPPYESGLELSLSWYPLNLLNISLGGVAFSHRYDFKLQKGMTINLTLIIDGKDYGVEATITRVSFPGDQHKSQGLEFVSTAFSKIDMGTKHILGRKILDIQRDLRSKELDS
ncbi:MAG: hypothetical protein C0407_12680 [Desulfobacca sp.]|nr:hypothetical protein [Desulfobacca sp.]